jgi:hypothetical protein
MGCEWRAASIACAKTRIARADLIFQWNGALAALVKECDAVRRREIDQG